MPYLFTEEYLHAIKLECEKAAKKFSPFATPHEGYAVILEELDEMWDAIKKNKVEQARKEAIQVGAMALRFLIDTHSYDKK